MTEQSSWRTFEGRDLHAEITAVLLEQIDNVLGMERWLLEDEGKPEAEIALALEIERRHLTDDWLPCHRSKYLAEFKANADLAVNECARVDEVVRL